MDMNIISNLKKNYSIERIEGNPSRLYCFFKGRSPVCCKKCLPTNRARKKLYFLEQSYSNL